MWVKSQVQGIVNEPGSEKSVTTTEIVNLRTSNVVMTSTDGRTPLRSVDVI